DNSLFPSGNMLVLMDRDRGDMKMLREAIKGIPVKSLDVLNLSEAVDYPAKNLNQLDLKNPKLVALFPSGILDPESGETLQTRIRALKLALREAKTLAKQPENKKIKLIKNVYKLIGELDQVHNQVQNLAMWETAFRDRQNGVTGWASTMGSYVNV